MRSLKRAKHDHYYSSGIVYCYATRSATAAPQQMILAHDIKEKPIFKVRDVQARKADSHLRYRHQIQIQAKEPRSIPARASGRIGFGRYLIGFSPKYYQERN